MARVDPITTEEDMQAAPLRALTRAGHVHTLHCFKNRAALQTSCWTSLSVPCQPQAHQMLNAGLVGCVIFCESGCSFPWTAS